MAVLGTINDTLVMIRDAARGADYGIGDVVQVFPGDTPCNVPPSPPFYFVLVTGLNWEAAKKYQESAMDNTDPAHPVLLHKRLYHIRVSLIPQAYRDLLQSQRWCTVTWTALRNFVRNKITNQTGG